MDIYNFHSVLIIGEPDLVKLRQDLGISEADTQILEDENLKIVQIRELLHWLHLKPMNSKKKLAVIRNAENMEIESANTLLKTLEEPPSYAQIILTTMNENRILSTIQSRCRKIRLNQDLVTSKPDSYLSPEEINELSLKEKFDWASSLAEKPTIEIKQVLTLWQAFYREKMLKDGSSVLILKQLNRAKGLLETNISVKLLVENLVLEINNDQETNSKQIN